MSKDLKDFGFQEEADLSQFGFQPETPSSSEEEASPEKMSALNAAALGAGQSASLGFADEIAGIAGGLGDKALSAIGAFTPSNQDIESGLSSKVKELIKKHNIDVSPAEEKSKSLASLISEYTQLQRDQLHKAEEDQPGAKLAGEVAGGFIAPVPGVSSAKAATLGAKIAEGALTGSVGGAVYGAGTSEGDVSDRLKDAASGAVVGAGLGGALPIVASAGKGLTDLLGNVTKGTSELVFGPLVDTYQLAKKQDILTKRGQQAIGEEMTQAGKQMAGDIKNEFVNLSKQRADILKGAEANKVNVSDAFKNAEQQAENLIDAGYQKTDKNKLKQLIEEYRSVFGSGEALTPEKAQQVKELTKEISNVGDKSLDSAQGKKIANELASQVSESLNTAMESTPFKDINAKIGGFAKAIESQKLDSHEFSPQDMMNVFVKAVEGENKNTSGAAKARQLADDFLSAVKEGNSELSDKYRKQIEEYATKMNVINRMPQKIRGGFLSQLGAVGTTAAAVAGTARRAAGEAISAPIKSASQLTKNIIESSPESLQNIVNQLQSAGSAVVDNSLVQSLKKAATSEPQRRKAILFGLMQQPEYRDKLHSLHSDEEAK